MDLFYVFLFVALVLIAFFLNLRSGTDEFNAASTLSDVDELKRFKTFRSNYLLVFCLMMAGDWLQGPYIYALYEHYGYTVGDIGHFFIMGFGSSLVFGTVVGSLADIIGRRTASLTYVVSYCLSCATKHSSRYWVLMLGRMLGGVSTSLLFSVFESWLVAEHNRRGFPATLLADTFSKAVFLGAGLVAILSGLAGNLLVEDLRLGPVAPFDAAIVVMLAGGVLVLATWGENYGDPNNRRSLGAQLMHGLAAIRTDRRIALLGAMQSMFEASMYTFVFLWTPALSPGGQKIPHGLVFSCFMTACMAGSAGTGLLVRRYSPQRYMGLVYGAGALTLAVPLFFHMERRKPGFGGSSLVDNGAGGMSVSGKLQLLAFCGFEACIGIFWPSMMALRAHFVPEELRSTIINIFRIPLNLFVCIVLYKVSAFPLSVMFGVCVGMLLACMVCQSHLNALTADEKHGCPLPITQTNSGECRRGGAAAGRVSVPRIAPLEKGGGKD
ncbi:hypothetical protein PLESTB_000207000 [Pleodorina starrii]|uniref:Molybdate-anion transporter n=1 Tax=Pleodorina starrii TaxID=330485 RepID=A0A9W6BD27_9CHLO|nr:hypothetical protein PLESTM_000324500 [Pleodorina starrii]GLC49326.1 hypothetical protein PLESTB_000207000 [Pleodorina starrii]GLC73417.1 hypothetical protein PLESTF_001373200 [Pleodorina starrii]